MVRLIPGFHKQERYVAYQGFGANIATSAVLTPRAKPGSLFKIAKRITDLLLVAALFPGFILCAFILACVNWMWNPGPILFSQERVGQYGRVFRILKFRSMLGDVSGPRFASQEMDRTTALGRFIRRTKIDELPQIINVLKAEMSIIGPRPEQVAFNRRYEHLIPGFALRQSVRPGITGLAQINHGYAFSTAGARNILFWDLET